MIISWHSSVLIGIATTLAVIAAASSAPAYTMAREMRSQTDMAATDYLTKFGYLSSPTSGNANSLVYGSSLTEAIKDFQSFFGLTVTGKEDEETLLAMARPRCGFRDKNGSGSDNRAQSYTLHGNRWSKRDLTYRITTYTNQLDRYTVDNEIERAFAVWSEHTDLTFTAKNYGSVDIEIKFVEGWHDNCDAFDGPGNTLAHASFPYSGGFAHFDDAEQWTIGTSYGINLFQVAAHEFGHSLGLEHSSVQSAIMKPNFIGYDPDFKLDPDDVEGIQALYGRKTNRGPIFPTQPPTRPTYTPPIADDPTNTVEPPYYTNWWNYQVPNNLYVIPCNYYGIPMICTIQL